MTTPTGDDQFEPNEMFEVFERKVFRVRAARVTEENIEVLARDIPEAKLSRTALPPTTPPHVLGRLYIQLPLVLNANKRQLQAFVGDWIVDFDGTYKVFGSKIFDKTYQRPEPETEIEIAPEGVGAEGGVVSVPAHNCCLHLHMPRHPNAQTIPFSSPTQNRARNSVIHRIAS